MSVFFGRNLALLDSFKDGGLTHPYSFSGFFKAEHARVSCRSRETLGKCTRKRFQFGKRWTNNPKGSGSRNQRRFGFK